MQDQDKTDIGPNTESCLLKSGSTKENQKLVIAIFALLNRQITSLDTIREILAMVKEFTGCEAAAIRLRQGEDFPYFVTQGFPGYFVEAENFLCGRTADGEVIRDRSGKPVLECMCGNVICGRTDASLPFFSEEGSFWTNSTTELLASTTEQDLQTRTRNRCNGEGYESVALIPLRSDREIIGLLQLNDSRKNCFTADMIGYMEGIGAIVGIVLTRIMTENALRKSEEKYRNIFNNAGVGMFRSRMDGSELLEVNDKFLKILNQTREEVIGKPSVTLWVDPHEREEMVRRINAEGQVTDFEYRMLTAEGEDRTCLTSLTIYPDQGILEGSMIDITDRKRMEQEKVNLIIELQKAMDQVKLLSGFLPICSSCKKIRDDTVRVIGRKWKHT